MRGPMAPGPLWVFKPMRGLARKINDQNVRPAIAIEIIDERQKIIRVGIVRPEGAFKSRDVFETAIGLLMLKGCRGRTVFMAFLEVRSFIPKWAGDNIHL